jgi:FixJ family two-component response regulator
VTTPGNVYVIDDDELLLEVLCAKLDEHGYDCSCHSDASAFLAQLPILPLGCLVTDLEMPDIDGLELQSRLQEAGSSMPVIFYSRKGTVRHAVEGMRAGASTFLRKGDDIGELLDALEQAFAKLPSSAR